MRCPVLIGRDAALAELARAISRAAGGHGTCVAVTGEAGVGKSRVVVAEAVDQARLRGQVVVLGRATPMDRISPLRPISEALLAGLRDHPRPEDPMLAAYLPALGGLVPHWAMGPALPAPPVVLAEGVLRVLRWLAPERGSVLVVEDVHWADGETLAVIRYMADHVATFPVAVVLTARSEEASSPPLRDVLAGNVVTVPLAPLADGEVAAMAAACLGLDAAPAPLVAAVQRDAAGLPLLVEDLVDEPRRRGPVRYRELVADRLARLDQAARDVVDAVAVLGNEADLDAVSRVADLGARELADAVTAARAVGLLTAAQPGVALRHALVRDLVWGQLDTRRRTELARRAAEVVESSNGAEVITERLGELWVQAGEPERAVGAWRRAAQAARVAGATAAAEALLRRSLAVARPEVMGPLRLELLDLLAVAGRVDELAASAPSTLDEVAGDRGLSVAVHLLLARAAVAAGAAGEAEHHLAAAENLGVLGLRQRAQLRIVGTAAVVAGRGAERAGRSAWLAEQAIEAADASGDPELRCEALELLAMSRRPRNLTAAADALQRELQVAEAAGLVLWRLRALNELGTVEMMRDARGDRLQRAYDLAVRVGALSTAASVSLNLAGLYVMTDRLPLAHGAAARARELAMALGAKQLVAATAAVDAVAHGLAGRRAEMEEGLHLAVELAPEDADLIAYASGGGRGLTALLFEDRAAALAAFRRGQRQGATIRAADPWMVGLLILAVQGDADVAEVESERRRAAVGERFASAWLGYAHAVVLAAAGHSGAANAAFQEAERAADRYPLFRAIALRLVAEAALTHPFGDPVAWLQEAEAAFVARRLPRIAGACRQLLARAGAPVTRRRGDADAAVAPELLRLGVSAREQEVLELVAEHLSNNDIAARLYLSPRTVEKHVASLLHKTGATDRTALGRLAPERR